MQNKKEFIVGAYCPPYPPKGQYGSRIKEESYQKLKDVGVNRVFGHFEDKYGYEYLEEAMNCCDRVGIAYFPRLYLFEQFIAVSGGYHVKNGVTYNKRSKEEKEKLNAEFVSAIEKIKDHPCFEGIFMSDENAFGSFDGVAEAKRLFERILAERNFIIIV